MKHSIFVNSTPIFIAVFLWVKLNYFRENSQRYFATPALVFSTAEIPCCRRNGITQIWVVPPDWLSQIFSQSEAVFSG